MNQVIDAEFEQDMISNFSGKYEYLRNDFPSNVILAGQVYPSVEHAFQAAKTDDKNLREEIRLAPSARKAKLLGRKAALSLSWEQNKVNVMEFLLRQKFSAANLSGGLLETGETNIVLTAKENFWGVDESGDGQNNLGKLLMKIRWELRSLASEEETKLVPIYDLVDDVLAHASGYEDRDLLLDLGSELDRLMPNLRSITKCVDQAEEYAQNGQDSSLEMFANDLDPDTFQCIINAAKSCEEIDALLKSVNS